MDHGSPYRVVRVFFLFHELDDGRQVDYLVLVNFQHELCTRAPFRRPVEPRRHPHGWARRRLFHVSPHDVVMLGVLRGQTGRLNQIFGFVDEEHHAHRPISVPRRPAVEPSHPWPMSIGHVIGFWVDHYQQVDHRRRVATRAHVGAVRGQTTV